MQPQFGLPVADFPVNTRSGGGRVDPNLNQFLFQQQMPQTQPRLYQPPSTVPPAGGFAQQQQVPAFSSHGMGQKATATAPNPFDILGIPRGTTDEGVVNGAYRKWAAILHPDRGGDPRRFQAVTTAYKSIMEVLQHAKSESFDYLKRQSEREINSLDSAGPVGPAPLGTGQQFNKETFNQVFSEHRMWDPNQDGYSDQMKEASCNFDNLSKMSPEELIRLRDQALTSSPALAEAAPLRDRFDEKQFNRLFQEKAPEFLQQRNAPGTSMVRRAEPEVMQMYQSATSMCGTLSYEKIDDFSSPFASGGSGGGGGFTDYMKAFSNEALITTHVNNVDAPNYQTFEELKQQRSTLSFVADPELERARAAQEAAEREQDEQRYRNFLKQQEAIEERHKKIRNVLADKSYAGK